MDTIILLCMGMILYGAYQMYYGIRHDYRLKSWWRDDKND